MQKTRTLSPELRWKLAAQAAVTLAFAFDAGIRRIAGEALEEEIDTFEKELWREGGREQGRIARELRCPAANAHEVAGTFNTLSTTLFGPDLTGEVLRGEGDFAVVVTRSCPFNNRTRELGADLERTCSNCQDYCKSAVESLNPEYELHYVQGMCRGDDVCEMVIREKP